MIIKRYNCNRFAGIKNKDIEFKDGLNVIVGSNEAGKSTLVEGIHSVLFRSSKIGNKSTEDKEFRKKFMPIPEGDSIDGEVIIYCNDEHYKLRKEWGSAPSVELAMPDSIVLKNEENIQEKLKDLLIYGEGTYSSLFFSKQRYVKEAIEKIVENKDAISEISSLLRQTVMELDGISLDRLENKINLELDQLLNKWDINKNYPENNRGISNPYKVGIGEIVQCFYKKETIKLDMEKANEAEKLFDDICNDIKNVQDLLDELKSSKENMEKIEDDILQRSILDPKIEYFNSQISVLTKINQEWPRSEENLKQYVLDAEKLDEERKNLEQEKELSKKLAHKERLEKTLIKVDEIDKEILELNRKLNLVNKVSKDDLEQLQKNQNEMINAESMLKAGVILGQINYLKDDIQLIVTKDFQDPIIFKIGESFTSNGHLKLEIEGSIEIELRSGDMDFKQLNDNYNIYKKNVQLILGKLSVENIEQAKINKEKQDQYNRDIENLNNKRDLLLEDQEYEKIKDKLAQLGDLSLVRDLDLIENELIGINNKTMNLSIEIKVLEANINKWAEEYKNIDGLFDKIVEIKMEQKEMNMKINKLAPLPSEYNTADEFREKLRQVRNNYEENTKLLSSYREVYYDREANLPSSNYEELQKDYLMEEIQYNKKIAKAKRLIKIKEKYMDTKIKMDEFSFTPIVEAFSYNLTRLTNGNYRAKEIDNTFNLKLEKQNDAIMPLNLLSTGTYDSVALALRLALLDNILEGNKGFLILDDCLVDLDPYRKDMAVELINEFAQKHQVIFTTCSPDTAKLLGGYIINM